MNIGNLEVHGVIYRITNIINKKSYIGQTVRGFNERYNCGGVGIERVYKYHKKLLNHKEWGFNESLYKDIVKYGLSNFEIHMFVDFAFSKAELDIKEQLWILKYGSTKNGYNKSIGGSGTKGVKKFGKDNSFYNKHHTEKVRKIISETHKGLGAKKVYCITTNKQFNSVQEAADFYKCDASGICKCCNNKRAYNGKYKGLRLEWCYLEQHHRLERVV